MTLMKKRAIGSLVIWSAVITATFLVFFSGGGPSAFLEGDKKVELTRIAITVGYLLYFALLILTRSRSRKTILTDERDEQTFRKAYTISFHALLYYTFLFGASLYLYYRLHLSAALMPVGWIWILAISALCVGFISNAAAVLIFDARTSGNGQG
ncbi:MAG: hypothetical protein WBB73_05005 [Candidatus Aminicenantaceae bacterium]